MRFEKWDGELIRFVSLWDLEMLNNPLSAATLVEYRPAGIAPPEMQEGVSTAMLPGGGYFAMGGRRTQDFPLENSRQC